MKRYSGQRLTVYVLRVLGLVFLLFADWRAAVGVVLVVVSHEIEEHMS